MSVRPLHDRLLVQRIDEGEQNIGGIIIPDTAIEKPQQGTVLAVGKGKVNDEGKRVPPRCQRGRRDPVWQVCGPGDQAGWRGVLHHERG
jgi:chaperonin GroES